MNSIINNIKHKLKIISIKWKLIVLLILLIISIIITVINKFKKLVEPLSDYENFNKSEFRQINTTKYKSDLGLQPIIVKSRVPVNKNGNISICVSYNNKTNNDLLKFIRGNILFINYKNVLSSKKSIQELINNNIVDNNDIDNDKLLDVDVNVNVDLAIARDIDIINNKYYEKLEIICPLICENIVFIGKNNLIINHLLEIRNSETLFNIFITYNDIELFTKIINILLPLHMNKNFLINKFETQEEAISQFILNKYMGILFMCVFVKDNQFNNLINTVDCKFINYIPSIQIYKNVNKYSFKNPYNEDKLKSIVDYETSKLHDISKSRQFIKINNKLYETLEIRNSLCISKNTRLSNYQLELLSSNIIQKYQTLKKYIDNTNESYNSLDFTQLANVNKSLDIEQHMKNELIKIGYIKIL